MGECYEQLSLSERIYIQSQLELGFKAAAIAAALKREAIDDQPRAAAQRVEAFSTEPPCAGGTTSTPSWVSGRSGAAAG